MTLTSGCVKIQKTLRLYIVRLERVELVSESDVLNNQNISRATGKTERSLNVLISRLPLQYIVANRFSFLAQAMREKIENFVNENNIFNNDKRGLLHSKDS